MTSTIEPCPRGIADARRALDSAPVEGLQKLSDAMKVAGGAIGAEVHQTLLEEIQQLQIDAPTDRPVFWHDVRLSDGRVRHCARQIDIAFEKTPGEAADEFLAGLVTVERRRFKGSSYEETTWNDDRAPALLERSIIADLTARGYEVVEASVLAADQLKYKGGQTRQNPGVEVSVVLRDPSEYQSYLKSNHRTRAEDQHESAWARFWRRL